MSHPLDAASLCSDNDAAGADEVPGDAAVEQWDQHGARSNAPGRASPDRCGVWQQRVLDAEHLRQSIEDHLKGSSTAEQAAAGRNTVSAVSAEPSARTVAEELSVPDDTEVMGETSALSVAEEAQLAHGSPEQKSDPDSSPEPSKQQEAQLPQPATAASLSKGPAAAEGALHGQSVAAGKHSALEQASGTSRSPQPAAGSPELGTGPLQPKAEGEPDAVPPTARKHALSLLKAKVSPRGAASGSSSLVAAGPQPTPQMDHYSAMEGAEQHEAPPPGHVPQPARDRPDLLGEQQAANSAYKGKDVAES